MAAISRPSIETFAAEVKARGVSYEEEAFILRAGGSSHWYVDIKGALCPGRLIAQAGELLLEQADNEGFDYEVVAGLGMGGWLALHAVGIALANSGKKRNVKLTEANDDRSPGQRYGYGLHGASVRGKKVWLVDDVATTGNSLITLADMVEREKGIVEYASVVADRNKGQAALALANMGITVHALLEFDEASGLLLPTAQTQGVVA